jgi:hypothetical protein
MTEHDPDALVLLRHCGDIHEAYLLRSVLEGDGIEAFIPDEFMSPLHPATVLSAGGVRLMVRAEDLARAQEILENGEGDEDPPAAG